MEREGFKIFKDCMKEILKKISSKVKEPLLIQMRMVTFSRDLSQEI